ncbi:MAG: hypothetical protein GF416_06995 [Candidatus Altiarchaeales archaeon]|nr:hypothetical protein [Candidatus Altiarchaeales archaeon]MBD3416859.1 hypothetical protein [Candidatus Altiarchaeales archaeon]
MACFSAPLAVGMITTACRKRIPEKYHIGWFNTLVLGGSAGLLLEHLASGEIVPYPPFLTAMASPAETAVMVAEIMSIGVPMLLACVGVWGAMVLAANYFEHTANSRAEHRA